MVEVREISLRTSRVWITAFQVAYPWKCPVQARLTHHSLIQVGLNALAIYSVLTLCEKRLVHNQGIRYRFMIG